MMQAYFSRSCVFNRKNVLEAKNIIEVQLYSAPLLSMIVCRYKNIIKAPLCSTDISHSPCVTVY